MKTKKSYEAPKLTVHGNVEAVTQQLKKTPTNLDKAFPAGTPFKDLTWS